MNQETPKPETVARQISAATSLRPKLALQLGSGFQRLLELVSRPAILDFDQLPGFPRSRAPGHQSRLFIGEISSIPVMILGGRAHYYEGYSMDQVTFPVRVLSACGITDLLLTNAAGGIAGAFKRGDLMAVTDHINLMGANPLRPLNVPIDSSPPAFLDLSRLYHPELLLLLEKAAQSVNITLHSGVYAAVSGPAYETAAEIRALAILGAHAVGMSTVPEAVAARQAAVRVAALSLITNLAAGRTPEPLSHREVLETGREHEQKLQTLIQAFVEEWGKQSKHITGEIPPPGREGPERSPAS